MWSSGFYDFFVFSCQLVGSENGRLPSIGPVNVFALDGDKQRSLNSIFDDTPSVFAVEAGTFDALETNVGPEEEVVVGVDGEITGLSESRVD